MGLNIYLKIQKIRCELQDLNLKKSGKNGFAGFNYYQLDDFIPVLNKLCLTNTLFTKFDIVNDVATLEIINAENITEKVVFTSPIADASIKGSTPIQCLGGVHTYMKRYLYLNAFEIVEPDLLDKLVATGKLEPKKEDEPVIKRENKEENVALKATKEQIDEILGYEQRFIDYTLKKLKLAKIEDISAKDAEALIVAVRNKMKKEN